eukprot:scaffold1880_cov115-Isochrysis_galbana.AAC.4
MQHATAGLNRPPAHPGALGSSNPTPPTLAALAVLSPTLASFANRKRRSTPTLSSSHNSSVSSSIASRSRSAGPAWPATSWSTSPTPSSVRASDSALWCTADASWAAASRSASHTETGASPKSRRAQPRSRRDAKLTEASRGDLAAAWTASTSISSESTTTARLPSPTEPPAELGLSTRMASHNATQLVAQCPVRRTCRFAVVPLPVAPPPPSPPSPISIPAPATSTVPVATPLPEHRRMAASVASSVPISSRTSARMSASTTSSSTSAAESRAVRQPWHRSAASCAIEAAAATAALASAWGAPAEWSAASILSPHSLRAWVAMASAWRGGGTGGMPGGNRRGTLPPPCIMLSRRACARSAPLPGRASAAPCPPPLQHSPIRRRHPPGWQARRIGAHRASTRRLAPPRRARLQWAQRRPRVGAAVAGAAAEQLPVDVAIH